jgi:lytic murein transglycosylase
MRDSLTKLTGLALSAALMAPVPASAGFQDCLASLRGQATSHGISAATFDTATRGLEPSDAASFLDKQPEFKTPIWDYIAGLVDEQRVVDGRERVRQYANALRTAESRFGVEPAIVVAVWGVESDFGRNMGKRPLVQSLATLSCEGRRRDYFRGEFFATLKIIQNGDIRPEALLGSWAGAFGHTQFMPSTYQRLAVDLEGHGRRDIVESIPDALGSTANHLKHGGWTHGVAWGFEVQLPEGYSGDSGRTHKHPMSYWSAQGIRRMDGRGLGDGAAGLMLPSGARGPAFLVTRNFDALYGYNAAESYALAIAHLADRIRGGGPFQTPWPTDDPGLGRAERKELQTLLMRKGYDVGEPDGAIGEKTRSAIADYQGRAGLPRDGRAGGRVLNALRSGR